MPEFTETAMQMLVLKKAIKKMKASEDRDSCVLQNILFDVTEAEAKSRNLSTRLKMGFIDSVPPGDTSFRRGQADNHTGYPVWPDSKTLISSGVGAEKAMEALSNVELDDAHILDGNKIVLECTDHWIIIDGCSSGLIQVYNLEQWWQGVFPVNQGGRRFCVIAAFVFPQYVVALTSGDFLANIQWRRKDNTLIVEGMNQKSLLLPDILTFAGFDDRPYIDRDLLSYLELFVSRIQLQTSETLSIGDFVLHNEELFPGIGERSISEMLFMAGLDPRFSVRDVFSNASRTARLWGSYTEYLSGCLETLLQIPLDDFVIASNNEQKMRFTRDFKTYGKTYLRVHARQKHLYVQLQGSIEAGVLQTEDDTGVFDVFEPFWIKSILNQSLSITSPTLSLACLIFGYQQWLQLSGHPPDALEVLGIALDDPLTRYFRAQAPSTETFLPSFDRLFPLEDHLKPHHLCVNAYWSQKDESHQTTFWSVYPPMPSCFRPIQMTPLSQDELNVKCTRGQVMLAMTHLLGPLDFPGTAIKMVMKGQKRQSGKIMRVLMCTNDPRPLVQPDAKVVQRAEDLFFASDKGASYMNKGASSQKWAALIEASVRTREDTFLLEPEKPSTDEPPRPVKRRRNATTNLIAENVSKFGDSHCSGRTRRQAAPAPVNVAQSSRI